MKNSRHSGAGNEGLLERIEDLGREGESEEEAPAGELAQTFIRLAEQIAETVASRIATDLLALPTEPREAETKGG